MSAHPSNNRYTQINALASAMTNVRIALTEAGYEHIKISCTGSYDMFMDSKTRKEGWMQGDHEGEGIMLDQILKHNYGTTFNRLVDYFNV